MVQLVDSLALAHEHARSVNTDGHLRRRLIVQQAEDRVPDDRPIGDPPLLRQETEAAHALLSVLLHLASGAGPAQAAEACQVCRRGLARCHPLTTRRACRLSTAVCMASGTPAHYQYLQACHGPLLRRHSSGWSSSHWACWSASLALPRPGTTAWANSSSSSR